MSKTSGQDMPPNGGYKPLQWERMKLKQVFGTKLTFGLFIGATTYGLVVYFYNYKQMNRENIEMRSARFALLPMLVAERDRAFLKQVRKNRNDERELMKNVDEWETGTYFREPLYITKQYKFVEPKYLEYFAHADWYDVNYRAVRRYMY